MLYRLLSLVCLLEHLPLLRIFLLRYSWLPIHRHHFGNPHRSKIQPQQFPQSDLDLEIYLNSPIQSLSLFEIVFAQCHSAELTPELRKEDLLYYLRHPRF